MKAVIAKKLTQFAGAVVLFSAVRQLLIFPWLAREHVEVFAKVTFLVFTFEALLYLLIGALPDYYAKRSNGDRGNPQLMERLLTINSYASLICFALPFMGVDLVCAIMLFPFFIFSGRNALKLKVEFNKLNYRENYFYVVYRVVPYLTLLSLMWLEGGVALILFCCALSASEFLYTLRLSKHYCGENAEYSTKGGLTFSWKSLSAFCLAYICISFAQRGDFTSVGYFYGTYEYTQFAMLMSIINFFCNPVALVSGAGLLSILVNQQVNLNRSSLMKILTPVIVLSLFVAGSAVLFFGYVEQLLYKREIGFSKSVIFLVVFSNVVFLSLRTFTIKFFSPKILLALYLMVCLLLGLFARLGSIEEFLNFFYLSRASLVVLVLVAYAYFLKVEQNNVKL